MLDKPLHLISSQEIQALVDARVSERQQLDYKEYLPRRDDPRNEFLADVTSFANAAGGHILYGVVDERDEDGQATGFPAQIVGVEITNVDNEKQRLRNRLADSVSPRLAGVEIQEVGAFDRGPVLIVRVPRSTNRPHMIATGASRFYSRDGSGKRPLDVSQIREAFVQSQELRTTIRRFRDDRLAGLLAGETPIPLVGTAALCLHVIPLQSFEGNQAVDLGHLQGGGSLLLRPMRTSGFNGFVNFDGFVRHVSGQYIQVFHSGVLEAVDSELFDTSRSQIRATAMEAMLNQAVSDYLNALEDLISVYPTLIGVSIVGVKGFRLSTEADLYVERRPIDRDVLVLPEVLVDGVMANPGSTMRPVYDAFWRALGVVGSPNYGRDGIWRARS
jgi:hypothetical protein